MATATKNNYFVIADQKCNKFEFYNMYLFLTDIMSFDSDRLVFSKPIAEKIPNTEMSYNRIFVAVTGPKARNVSKTIQNVYDVSEVLDYDENVSDPEFKKLYDFSKLKDTDYHVVVNLDWYKSQNAVKFPPNISKDTFMYNMRDDIYKEDDKENIELLRQLAEKHFTFFDATKEVAANHKILDNIPKEQYSVLLSAEWIKSNLSQKWRDNTKKCHCMAFSSGEVFSFGLSQNKQDEKSTTISYQISLCLFDQKNPTNEQFRWALKYDELANVCRKECFKSPKYRNLARDMRGLTWTKDTINIEEGPKLYPKIMFKQNRSNGSKDANSLGEFVTVFKELDGPLIQDPFEIVNKRAVVQVSMKLESIFMGIKVALQTRVNDVLVVKWIKPFEPRALITRSSKPATTTSPSCPSSSDEDDLVSSSSDEDDEKPVPETATPKRKVTSVKM